VTFTGRVGSILRVTSWEEELTRTHSKEEKREREKKQQLTNWETRQKKMVKDYTESTTTHVSCCFFLPASSFIITGYLQSIVYMYERCHQYLTMSENRVDKV
jgi:hypothetical protein